tara:strand:- start:153 stop:698 length:546 start_codon:yes stop_codon:yes gene_type:complete
MNKIFPYIFLVLMWYNVGVAEEIKEIEIEGMSIGDSLLEYFTEEEIKEATVPEVYPDKFEVTYNIKETLRYDFITVTYKFNDKKYKIYGISTGLNFSNDIQDCYKEQDKLVKEISMNWKHWGILPFDEENNSTYKPITFEDAKGDAISISCYYFPENTSDNNLKISLDLREFKNYLKKYLN